MHLVHAIETAWNCLELCAYGYARFLCSTQHLPEAEPRYLVYDFAYTNADGCIFDKLLFILWSPDSSPIKKKMVSFLLFVATTSLLVVLDWL